MDEVKTLEGLRCEKCGRVYIPPKVFCSECGNEKLHVVNLKGRGEVYSYTTIRVPPLDLEEEAPFDLLLVRLEEGINITTRVAKGKNDNVIIGDKVIFDKKENGVYYFRIAY